MRPPTRNPTGFSKFSVKSQRRAKLGVKPGDTLRYCVTDDGVLIDKALTESDDPFVIFTEWAGEADEKAYGGDHIFG